MGILFCPTIFPYCHSKEIEKYIFPIVTCLQAEDEWKEYDEEKKDYSNLKIETLKVESDEEEAGNDDEHEINEDGEKVPKKEGGVWSKGKAEGTKLITRDMDNF